MLFPEADCSRIIVAYPDCVELLNIGHGVPVGSEVVERVSLNDDAVKTAAGRWGEDLLNDTGTQWYAFSYELEKIRSSLHELCRGTTRFTGEAYSRVTEYNVPAVLPISTLFKKRSIREAAVFGDRKRRRTGLLSLFLVMILLVSVFVPGLLFMRGLHMKETRLAELKTGYRMLEAGIHELISQEEELALLEKSAKTLDAAKPADLYRFLSLLRRALGPDVRVLNISVRERTFELEGIAESPFSLIERFGTFKTDFSGLFISRVAPRTDGPGQRYSLTGAYRGE